MQRKPVEKVSLIEEAESSAAGGLPGDDGAGQEQVPALEPVGSTDGGRGEAPEAVAAADAGG